MYLETYDFINIFCCGKTFEIADKEWIMKKGKHLMIPFFIVTLVVLVLILSVWNHATNFNKEEKYGNQ